MVNHGIGQEEEVTGLYSDKTVLLYSVGSTEPVFQQTHADFCALGDRVELGSGTLSLVRGRTS